MDKLLRRLDQVDEELKEVEGVLATSDAPARPDFAELSRKYARLRELSALGQEVRKLQENIAEEEELLQGEEDENLRAELETALEGDRSRLEKLAGQVKKMLVPDRPQDKRNAIMEVRAGAGGEESALFAADLFRMYARYAERMGWEVRVLDSHPTPLGGFKHIVFALEGKNAFGNLRLESGVHRVQRVPETETQGRVHTSTATVAVLPEVEDVEVEVSPDELRMETYRAGGPGGQHMQKNETAVRIIHEPTGLIVTCQDERSQHRNREQAIRLLKARLWDARERQREADMRETRRRQIGSGDRSEKIRTYNFPQSRVTDHRLGLTVYQLEQLMEGELERLLQPLFEAEVEELLEE
ncbi:MAG: peptide chain release factor 1 [Candidatus Bipolaricaulota bacterium]